MPASTRRSEPSLPSPEPGDTVHVRLSKAEKEQLVQWCTETHRTISTQIRHVLAVALQERSKKKTKATWDD